VDWGGAPADKKLLKAKILVSNGAADKRGSPLSYQCASGGRVTSFQLCTSPAFFYILCCNSPWFL